MQYKIVLVIFKKLAKSLFLACSHGWKWKEGVGLGGRTKLVGVHRHTVCGTAQRVNKEQARRKEDIEYRAQAPRWYHLHGGNGQPKRERVLYNLKWNWVENQILVGVTVQRHHTWNAIIGVGVGRT